jgi:DNA modification methylase
VVLDPFIGSGTTAVAAMKLRRHFVGMEANDEYYQVALKRIEQERQVLKRGQESLEPFTR